MPKRSRKETATFVNYANSFCRAKGRGKTIRSLVLFEELAKLTTLHGWRKPTRHTRSRVMRELRDRGIVKHRFKDHYDVVRPLHFDPYEEDEEK